MRLVMFFAFGELAFICWIQGIQRLNGYGYDPFSLIGWFFFSLIFISIALSSLVGRLHVHWSYYSVHYDGFTYYQWGKKWIEAFIPFSAITKAEEYRNGDVIIFGASTIVIDAKINEREELIAPLREAGLLVKSNKSFLYRHPGLLYLGIGISGTSLMLSNPQTLVIFGAAVLFGLLVWMFGVALRKKYAAMAFTKGLFL
jgi:hypothetical protein